MKEEKKHKIYLNTEGVEVPSVTTIIKLINKPELIGWANFLGFKQIKVDSVLKETSTIGTLVHERIYNQLMSINKNILDDVHYINESVDTIMENFNNFMYFNKPKLETMKMETELVSRSFGGTVDWYGNYNNVPTVLDFKTSKQVRDSMWIQLGGYTYMLRENGYPVEQGAIFIVNKNNTYIKTISKDELDEYMDLFLKLLDLFHTYNKLKKGGLMNG